MKQLQTHDMLSQKRENFRVSIRREKTEELFNENRKKVLLTKPASRDFSNTQDLHHYLISDQARFEQKIQETFQDPALLSRIIQSAPQDYYSLLILSNIVISDTEII